MKTTSSINMLQKDRIALSIVTDNMQSVIFLTRIEFMELMSCMFDYRDGHKDELKEAIEQLNYKI